MVLMLVSKKKTEFEKREAFVQPQTALQRLDGFFEHAGGVKIEIVLINDPFVSRCTVSLVDKRQDTAGHGPSGSGSLYVKNSE